MVEDCLGVSKSVLVDKLHSNVVKERWGVLPPLFRAHYIHESSSHEPSEQSEQPSMVCQAHTDRLFSPSLGCVLARGSQFLSTLTFNCEHNTKMS